MDRKPISRFEFFKEIKDDLKQTAKEFLIPIIEDDIDKVDQVFDDIIGIKWHEIGKIEPEYLNGIKDYYIDNQNIAVFCTDNKLMAINNVCPDCQNLLNWISYDKKFKCFQCEGEFFIENEKDNPRLDYYTLKEENDIWLVALTKTII
ncbi:MAG: hypothetical protein AB7V16_02340 [Vulcanibacillus sp.]